MRRGTLIGTLSLSVV